MIALADVAGSGRVVRDQCVVASPDVHPLQLFGAEVGGQAIQVAVPSGGATKGIFEVAMDHR